MQKKKAIKDWQRMYDELNDPELKEKAKYRHDKEKYLEAKKKDTGL